MEKCKVCDKPVLVMAHKGTGICSRRCEKADVRA
jgi:endogenous inhibitor of DNA gyrase (YacG/DUF329 family)